MKLGIARWGLLALVVASLAGCLSGGDLGVGGSTGAVGEKGDKGDKGDPGLKGDKGDPGLPAGSSNYVDASAMTAAQWLVGGFVAEVTDVSIPADGKPVVNFKVNAADGKPVVGLANTGTSQAATATVASRTNVAFTLAKLVPGAAAGEPSKWVSYLVTAPPTVAQAAATPPVLASGTYPTSDSQGTLVDNGDGTYQYTFYRSVSAVKDLVASTAFAEKSATSTKADLGDLTYNPALTHRLGMQIGGAMRGTGRNTPTGDKAPTTVNMGNPVNLVYDFRPAGGTIADTRTIVSIDNCAGCHDNGVLAHGSRKDPNYCVTCHTDQTKYSFTDIAYADFDGTKDTTKVDGKSLLDFPVLVHKVHMGKMTKNSSGVITRMGLMQPNYNIKNALKVNAFMYPQDQGNCTKCHTESTATPDGDNWKTKPSRLACGACHDGIDFATGTGTTVAGATDGHAGKNLKVANDGLCLYCHDGETAIVDHSTKIAASANAAKRTMEASITDVTIDVAPTAVTGTDTTGSTGTGNVTVTFTLTKGGVAVTDAAAFKSTAFTLAKLNPAAKGASTNWQSYTARARTQNAAKPPVITGYSENVSAYTMDGVAAPGTLTHMGSGVWKYTFKLDNATAKTDANGNPFCVSDIRCIDHVHNATSGTITGPYSAANMPTLPHTASADLTDGDTVTILTANTPTTVAYEWWKTHRVGMEFQEADGTANKFNAIYDFVPVADSARPAATRNIVSMDTCAGRCHGGSKLHKGYTTEYCVTCHNQNTADPNQGVLTGTTATAVAADFQRMVHRIHAGGTVTSPVTVGTHNYSEVVYPADDKKCEVCHSATATKADGTTALENIANWYTTPTSRACGTCHDSDGATGHIQTQISSEGYEACTTCHGANSSLSVKTVHGLN